MIVRLDQASYSYPGRLSRTVLHNVNFELAEGQTISVLGRNGTGKSTLLALVAGLGEVSTGSVESPARRGVRVPTVFQDYRASLFPQLSALDNIALPLVLLGKPRERAREAAERIALDAGVLFDLHQRPGKLSGGQAQLVSLLRALILNAPLVLLDEPSSALDIFASIDLALLTSRLLRDRGSAAIYVSHSIDEAILVADKLVVLAGSPGRVAGTVATALSYPRDRSQLNSSAFVRARQQVLELIGS